MEPRAIRPATWRARTAPDRADNSSAVSNFTTAANAILTVRDLDVTPLQPGASPLLSGVSFSLGAGERMAIVGQIGRGQIDPGQGRTWPAAGSAPGHERTGALRRS